MRYSSLGDIAYNWQQKFYGCWLNNATQLITQPVILSNPDGPWQLVTRQSGVIAPLPGGVGGANEWCAGGDRWMRYLAGHPLAGSQVWEPSNGFAGDMSRDGMYAVTISADGKTLYVYSDGVKQANTIARTAPFGGVRVQGSVVAWCEFPNATHATTWIRAFDMGLGVFLDIQTLPVNIATPIVFKHADAVDYWVIYGTDELGGVCHRINDSSTGYRFGVPKDIWDPDTVMVGDECRIGYTNADHSYVSQLIIPTLGEAMVPLVIPPAPVEEPIGPRGPAHPKGELIDLSPYFTYDARSWPRGDKKRGDTHGMDMEILPATDPAESYRLAWVKFDKDGQGKAFELKSVDKDINSYIHVICDASNANRKDRPDNPPFDPAVDPYIDTWTDTRWLKRQMRIGEVLTFHCERVVYHPRTGRELFREPYTKEMELLNVWDRYYYGLDFGICRVLEWRYNVERCRVAIAADGRIVGWGDWDYTDPSHPIPSHPQDADSYSRFLLFGGQRFPVQLPNCPLLRQVPSEHPVTPIPTDVFATLKQMDATFPMPLGGDEVVMHHWSRRAAEQVKFRHNGQDGWEWGLKSSSPGSPTSHNITRRRGEDIDTWDYILGSSSATPRINPTPDHYYIPKQVFIPVDAVNYLDLQPPTNRPALTLPFWGATAFDLASSVASGDWRYYDLLKSLKLSPRVNFYVTINAPDRYYRDFTTGMAQMRVLLPKMAADGMKGQFIFLVGTTPDGISRAEALNRIRQMDALLRQYPQTVAGVQGGNENFYPGLEESYMSDPAFWQEAEAIVDPRFPFAWGAGHGGQGVSMAGGSYLVHHSDRALSPEAAGLILRDAQALAKRPVVDDEPRRIEANGSGQSTGDLNFVRGLIAAAKQHKYGLTMHVAAGRGCKMEFLDDVQQQALSLISLEVVAPVPVHPILDCNLSEGATPDAFSHAGYTLFVFNKPALIAEARAWYFRGTGLPMSAEQESFFVDIRCNRECHRWVTPRAAWTNALPGGAPKT